MLGRLFDYEAALLRVLTRFLRLVSTAKLREARLFLTEKLRRQWRSCVHLQ